MRLLGETLARAGVPTIRLSWHGTGESLGADEDPGRVAAWIGSVHAAVDALSGLTGVERVGLVGLRLGATLAATAAEGRRIDSLVLWEPCRSGAAYAREMEILAAGTRKALTGDASPPPGQVGIESAGYLLTPETVDALGTLDLANPVLAGEPDVLILSRDDRPAPMRLAEPFEAQGCRTLHERVPGFKEMMVYPLRSRRPVAVLERIRDWALERAEVAAADGGEAAQSPSREAPPRRRPEGGGSRTGGHDMLDDAVCDGAVCHRVVRLGPGGRLFGMLAEPANAPPAPAGPNAAPPRPAAAGPGRAPVLLLTGGIVPRTAVNRMYVTLARRLAAAGHRVLRVDVSGIGESDPEPGRPPDDAYPSSLLADVRAAADVLVDAGADPSHDEGLVVVGLCSGGYAAYQLALRDARVRGVTLINPIVYYPERGLSFANEFAAGDAPSERPRRSLVGRVVGRVARTWDRILSRLRRGRLARDLERLSRRGVRVRFAFSRGDPGHATFAEALGARAGVVEASGVRVRVFEGADHTFNPLGPRAVLLDWIVEGIEDGPAQAG